MPSGFDFELGWFQTGGAYEQIHPFIPTKVFSVLHNLTQIHIGHLYGIQVGDAKGVTTPAFFIKIVLHLEHGPDPTGQKPFKLFHIGGADFHSFDAQVGKLGLINIPLLKLTVNLS